MFGCWGFFGAVETVENVTDGEEHLFDSSLKTIQTRRLKLWGTKIQEADVVALFTYGSDDLFGVS